MTDLAAKDISQVEWKYSDCLRLNNKENIFVDTYNSSSKKEDSGGVQRQSRKSSLVDQSGYVQDLDEKNKVLEIVNKNNEEKLQVLDKENIQLRQQLQTKQIQKVKSTLNPSKLSTLSDNNILKVNNQLQNIPEQEAEETPMNRHTLKGYQKSTISFAQYSADQSGSEGGQGVDSKRKKKSKQKIQMLGQNGGIGSIGSSVRRLFTSTTNNNTPSTTANNTPYANIQSSNRNSLVTTQSDTKYDSITPKIDSNLEKKHYHEEIIRKNKLKFNNFQSCLNSSIVQSDSNDLTMLSIASGQNYNGKSFQSQNNYNNDDTISRISQSCCYEDLNHLFNAPNQNQNVKLKYYSYLLEESYFQHEKFTQKVASSINNEYNEFTTQNESKQSAKLLENIEKQSKQIESLKDELQKQTTKSEQLSQLVMLYKEQIVVMNGNNEIMLNQIKEIQDELSTIDIFFQFEDDLDLINTRDKQLIQTLESVPTLFNSGVDKVKQNVKSLLLRIADMDKQITANKEEYNKNLENLKQKLDYQLVFFDKQKDLSFCNSEMRNQKSISMYECLSATVERTIEVMANLQQQSEKQKQVIKKKDQDKKHYQSINRLQKYDFDAIIQKLEEQFIKLKKQQIRLEEEIFDVRLDKNRILYQKLKKKLDCKFMHSSKTIEQELLNTLNYNNNNYHLFQNSNCPSDIQINLLPQQSNDKGISLQLQQAIQHQNENQIQKQEKGQQYGQQGERNEQQSEQAAKKHEDQGVKSNDQQGVIGNENIKLNQFNQVNLCRSLYVIANTQHENLMEYKKIILEFVMLLEWLEICINVDSQGNLKMNESLLAEISSPELLEWAGIFKKNISTCIQQHIKRQVDSKIDLPSTDRIKLKHLIYAGNYDSYFSILIQKLSSVASSNTYHSIKIY